MKCEQNLGFLYKKCSLHNAALNGLLQTPVFREEIFMLIQKNITINDRVVFEIVEKLYDEWKPKRYSKEYKQKYIDTYGAEKWKNDFQKHYRHIADGRKAVNKAKKEKLKSK